MMKLTLDSLGLLCIYICLVLFFLFVMEGWSRGAQRRAEESLRVEVQRVVARAWGFVGAAGFGVLAWDMATSSTFPRPRFDDWATITIGLSIAACLLMALPRWFRPR